MNLEVPVIRRNTRQELCSSESRSSSL